MSILGTEYNSTEGHWGTSLRLRSRPRSRGECLGRLRPRGELIREWLKAGFIAEGKLNPTEKGTPQGGVISPLLANIGLHGLEEYTKEINPKLGIIRYADDFIITAKDQESLMG